MSSQGLGQSKIGILTCGNRQIIENKIERKLEMVVAEQSQPLTQHLGPYFPRPFSLVLCVTRVFNLFVFV